MQSDLFAIIARRELSKERCVASLIFGKFKLNILKINIANSFRMCYNKRNGVWRSWYRATFGSVNKLRRFEKSKVRKSLVIRAFSALYKISKKRKNRT
jgi:hypothetical protein